MIGVIFYYIYKLYLYLRGGDRIGIEYEEVKILGVIVGFCLL